MKLLKYNESTDYILMAVECLFIIFIIYYLVEESIEINVHGCAYFANPGLSGSVSDLFNTNKYADKGPRKQEGFLTFVVLKIEL